MTVVINLFGSAGSGKSTTALGLTYFLKLKGYRVEYVTEYAKDLVNEGSLHKLKHQIYVFSKQLKRMEVLMEKGLDFIVCDSPLLLSLFYGEKYNTAPPSFRNIVLDCSSSFSNFNVFLNRAVQYDPLLRLQTEEESDKDSEELLSLLRREGATIHVFGTSDETFVKTLANRIVQVTQEKG